MVGMGWTGSTMACELTKAGLQVVGLERGPNIKTSENFAMPHVRDELRYMQRLDQIQDPAMETLTFRHRPYRPLLLPRWLDSPPSLRIPMKSPGHSEMMSPGVPT